MNIFEKVKQSVTTRQAASFYGLKVGRNGMCRCPFHNDKKPSMKVDERFHCFGCGADGDVINFAAKLKGVGNGEATRILAGDFGIDLGDCDVPRPARQRKRNRKSLYQSDQARLQVAVKNFYRRFTDYYHVLRDWKERYVPRSPDDAWDERFCEALEKLTKIEYALDCFLEGDLQEQVDIMNDYGKDVEDYERSRKDRDHREDSREPCKVCA